MVQRARTPLRVSVWLIGSSRSRSPLFLGDVRLLIGGLGATIILWAASRAIERDPFAFPILMNILNVVALGVMAYAVFVVGVSPVITVYFPVLLLHTMAYVVGVRAAVFVAVPSLVLVVATVVADLPEERPVGPLATLLVRAGMIVSVLIFAVTMRRAHDQQAVELQLRATTDPLTGLANRLEFDRAIREALDRTGRGSHTGALVYVDIDNMKAVNDTYGHGVGDRFLQEVARRIMSVTRSVDTAARLGGDEFVVVLPEVNAAAGSEAYTEKLIEELHAPFQCGFAEIEPSASIGVTTFTGGTETADELLRRADRAMYEAKRAGGRRIVASALAHPPEN